MVIFSLNPLPCATLSALQGFPYLGRAVTFSQLRSVTPRKAKQWAPLLFSSVQFSHPVMSNSLRPRESQHARPPVGPEPPSLSHSSIGARVDLGPGALRVWPVVWGVKQQQLLMLGSLCSASDY